MEEEKIKSEKPRINARLWRKEDNTQKIEKKVRLWRKKEKQGNTEIPRKSESMEVKTGEKEKKNTEKPRKSNVTEARKRKYRNVKKKQEDGEKLTEKQRED